MSDYDWHKHSANRNQSGIAQPSKSVMDQLEELNPVKEILRTTQNNIPEGEVHYDEYWSQAKPVQAPSVAPIPSKDLRTRTGAEGFGNYFAKQAEFELKAGAINYELTPDQAARSAQLLTLPTDSQERKEFPLFRGVLQYFPAALAGIAKTSKMGNDKHNPGQELHHARGKSTDHADCIIRHLMDTADLMSARKRGASVSEAEILHEVNQLAWRALALSQELHEKFGSPLAPGAKENT